MFPADEADSINPDTHLLLTYKDVLTLCTLGQVRIDDISDNRLVDLLNTNITHGNTVAKCPGLTELYLY